MVSRRRDGLSRRSGRVEYPSAAAMKAVIDLPAPWRPADERVEVVRELYERHPASHDTLFGPRFHRARYWVGIITDAEVAEWAARMRENLESSLDDGWLVPDGDEWFEPTEELERLERWLSDGR
jgi:hypothetical protein